MAKFGTHHSNMTGSQALHNTLLKVLDTLLKPCPTRALSWATAGRQQLLRRRCGTDGAQAAHKQPAAKIHHLPLPILHLLGPTQMRLRLPLLHACKTVRHWHVRWQQRLPWLSNSRCSWWRFWCHWCYCLTSRVERQSMQHYDPARRCWLHLRQLMVLAASWWALLQQHKATWRRLLHLG